MSKASDDLSARIRAHYGDHPALIDKKMFGGAGFMLNGNMVAGSTAKGVLMIRANPDTFGEALARPGAFQLQMGERMMKGFIGVEDEAIEDDEALGEWLDYAMAYVRTMPPKRK